MTITYCDVVWSASLLADSLNHGWTILVHCLSNSGCSNMVLDVGFRSTDVWFLKHGYVYKCGSQPYGCLRWWRSSSTNHKYGGKSGVGSETDLCNMFSSSSIEWRLQDFCMTACVDRALSVGPYILIPRTLNKHWWLVPKSPDVPHTLRLAYGATCLTQLYVKSAYYGSQSLVGYFGTTFAIFAYVSTVSKISKVSSSAASSHHECVALALSSCPGAQWFHKPSCVALSFKRIWNLVSSLRGPSLRFVTVEFSDLCWAHTLGITGVRKHSAFLSFHRVLASSQFDWYLSGQVLEAKPEQ